MCEVPPTPRTRDAVPPPLSLTHGGLFYETTCASLSTHHHTWRPGPQTVQAVPVTHLWDPLPPSLLLSPTDGTVSKLRSTGPSGISTTSSGSQTPPWTLRMLLGTLLACPSYRPGPLLLQRKPSGRATGLQWQGDMDRALTVSAKINLYHFQSILWSLNSSAFDLE